jgi:hypothetical protein
VAGLVYGWETWIVVAALVIVLAAGLVTAVVSVKDRELWLATQRFRQLAAYFTRRFTGESSLSVFAIIEHLFAVENPEVWNWARACDMSKRVFNTWADGFTTRMESDIRARNFSLYLHTYINELWQLTSHYHEFVEQLYEVMEKIKAPREMADQYSRFVVEYNAFVQDFRDHIVRLRKITRTQIEPPSVKLARELTVVEAPPVSPKPKTETRPLQTDPKKGYIL